jgi:hypothetical protein
VTSEEQLITRYFDAFERHDVEGVGFSLPWWDRLLGTYTSPLLATTR